MNPELPRICIYPGCERPVVPPHALGGPPSSFCDLEEHNALSAHQERRRLAGQPPRTAAAGREPGPRPAEDQNRVRGDGNG